MGIGLGYLHYYLADFWGDATTPFLAKETWPIHVFHGRHRVGKAIPQASTDRMLIVVFNRALVCSSLSLYYRTIIRIEDITYTVIYTQILKYVENSFSMSTEI